MSDLSKKFSIHSSASSLNLLFFLPDLLCTAIRRLNLLARVSITSAIFCGLDGRDDSVLWSLRWRRAWFCFWGWRCSADLQFLWHFFLMVFPEKDSFFLLEHFVHFGYRCFLLSLSVIFSCGIIGLIQIILLLTISSAVMFVFCLPFSITSC